MEKEIKKNSFTYKDSGVDKKRADLMLSSIQDLISNNAGGFAGFFPLLHLIRKYNEPYLVACTDGIGTKLILLKEKKKWETAAIDLIAMNLNDLICTGAEPLFFLDYYSSSKIDPEGGAKFLNALKKELKKYNCILLGGETAELSDLYKTDGIDIAGFVVGIVDKNEMLGKHKVKEGDIIIGLSSSGIHSNGFTLVRNLLNNKKIEFNENLIAPTRVYVEPVLKIKNLLHAAANITGGGLPGNLNRVIPENMIAEINNLWKPHKIFYEIRNSGVNDNEMLEVFNCGIGFCLIVPENNVDKVLQILKSLMFDSFIIGIVKEKNEILKNINKNKDYISEDKKVVIRNYKEIFN